MIYMAVSLQLLNK